VVAGAQWRADAAEGDAEGGTHLVIVSGLRDDEPPTDTTGS
jgi:hypothetical protein